MLLRVEFFAWLRQERVFGFLALDQYTRILVFRGTGL